MLKIEEDGTLRHIKLGRDLYSGEALNKCEGEYSPVYCPETKQTKGFYCLSCGDYEVARGEEKNIPIGGLK